MGGEGGGGDAVEGGEAVEGVGCVVEGVGRGWCGARGWG